MIAGLRPLHAAAISLLLGSASGCPASRSADPCAVPGTDGCACTSAGACDPGLLLFLRGVLPSGRRSERGREQSR
jgi:hypothetical protein